MAAEALFLVVVATFTMNGKPVEPFVYATNSLEIACAVKKDAINLCIHVRKGMPTLEGWLFTSGEWCPPRKAEESEPFDFEKLLDEVEAGIKHKTRECPQPFMRKWADLEIKRYEQIIANPDVSDATAADASRRIGAIRLSMQECALDGFMRIK